MRYQFIPDSDKEFARMAEVFANTLASDPARYHLSPEVSAMITRRAKEFRKAYLAVFNKGTKNKTACMEKDAARKKAEDLIRKYGNVIRANPDISPIDKMLVRVQERPKKLRDRNCPKTAPLLTFVKAIPANGSGPKRHVLTFRNSVLNTALGGLKVEVADTSRAKPPGAARIELFVELVAEHEPMPKHPGELSGGRPWYLQSFTKNPIEVEFPVPQSPATVVYWARWADAKGNVGPFSKTTIAQLEGSRSSAKALPDPTAVRRRQQKIVITSARLELPDQSEETDEMCDVIGRLLPEPRA